MTNKIINTFQQRRQLQEAVTSLGDTATELELTQAVRAIIHQFPHDLVLTMLLKQLDTEKGQLRGGLGHLARLLPPDLVVPALRSAAANRQHKSNLRLNAVTILENYLGERVPSGLLSDLMDTDEIAFRSLREALDVAHRNRHVLLEYVTQMRQEGEEVAFMVLNLLKRMIDTEQIELLRLIAQDDRPSVAQAALTQLGQLDLTKVGSQVVRAMHILQQTLPPPLAEQTHRTARKLHLRGIRYKPPATDGWRALLSLPDVNGHQSVWLLYRPQKTTSASATSGILCTLDVNLALGLQRMVCIDGLAMTDLPAPVPIGEIIMVPVSEKQSVVMIEAPFEYGRWLIQAALAVHWRKEGRLLALGEYVLYNDLIWQFAPPQIDETLEKLVAPSLLSDVTPDADTEEMDGANLDADASLLLQHPVMERWLAYMRTMLTRTPYLAARCAEIAEEYPSHHEAVRVLLQEVLELPDGPTLMAGLEAGLRAQAGFLHLMGSSADAHRAQRLAQSLTPTAYREHPLLLHLFGVGFDGVV